MGVASGPTNRRASTAASVPAKQLAHLYQRHTPALSLLFIAPKQLAAAGNFPHKVRARVLALSLHLLHQLHRATFVGKEANASLPLRDRQALSQTKPHAKKIVSLSAWAQAQAYPNLTVRGGQGCSMQPTGRTGSIAALIGSHRVTARPHESLAKMGA